MNDLTREEMNARLETIETRMDGRLVSIENMIDTKFAKFDAALQKANAETIKWVAGTVIAASAVSLTLVAFFVNNSPQRTAPPLPPIIITLPVRELPVPPPTTQGKLAPSSLDTLSK